MEELTGTLLYRLELEKKLMHINIDHKAVQHFAVIDTMLDTFDNDFRCTPVRKTFQPLLTKAQIMRACLTIPGVINARLFEMPSKISLTIRVYKHKILSDELYSDIQKLLIDRCPITMSFNIMFKWNTDRPWILDIEFNKNV